MVRRAEFVLVVAGWSLITWPWVRRRDRRTPRRPHRRPHDDAGVLAPGSAASHRGAS
ncbi:hypothetical protein HBB16_17915 [Pseudonocardia sp. MCCB 268]|nr:hypothetical protein [Pseudonocardia cytotoxica]